MSGDTGLQEMSTLEREENPTLELYPVGKLYKFTE